MICAISGKQRNFLYWGCPYTLSSLFVKTHYYPNPIPERVGILITKDICYILVSKSTLLTGSVLLTSDCIHSVRSSLFLAGGDIDN